MTFNITLGWWLVPTAVTAAAYAWHNWLYWGEAPASGYGAIGDGLARGLTFFVATTAALIAWLVYFVVA